MVLLVAGCGGEGARQVALPLVGVASSEPETDADCGKRFFALLRELHMTTARLVLYRGNVQLRDRVRCAIGNAEGIELSLVLIDVPQAIRDAQDVDAFASWAAGVAREFPEVRRFVVWNEPNLPAFWRGDARLYAGLLAATTDALHAVDADIRVSGFGLGPSHRPLDFLRAARRAGARMDELSIHPFPPGNRASARAAYRLVRRIERVWPGPLNLDEVGWQAETRRGGYTGDENVLTTTEAEQTERYVTFVRLAVRDPRVRSVLIYRLVDEGERRAWQSGLVRADGKRRPAFGALRGYLVGCRPFERVPIAGAVACASVVARKIPAA